MSSCPATRGTAGCGATLVPDLDMHVNTVPHRATYGLGTAVAPPMQEAISIPNNPMQGSGGNTSSTTCGGHHQRQWRLWLPTSACSATPPHIIPLGRHAHLALHPPRTSPPRHHTHYTLERTRCAFPVHVRPQRPGFGEHPARKHMGAGMRKCGEVGGGGGRCEKAW